MFYGIISYETTITSTRDSKEMKNLGQYILNLINKSVNLPRYLLLLLCLYVYIYNPIFQVLGFGVIKILLFISLIYILISNKLSFIITNYKNEIIFTYFLITYAFISAVFGDGSAIVTPYQHLIWFLECFIIPCFLLFFFKDIFKKISWESVIIITGFIASVITLYLVLNPDLNIIIRNNIIIDTRDTVIRADAAGDYRGFTIAESSMFGYGVVQGIILVLCLYFIRKNFLNIIPVIFLFISIIFNARIGLAVLIIFIPLLIIYKRLKLSNLIILCVLLISGYYVLSGMDFFEEYKETLEWGMNFYKDAESYLRGEEKISNYTLLVEYMLFFPKNLSGLIFGEGRNVYGLGIGIGSDIGYVNQIFTGGLIYLSLMLAFLGYSFKRLYSHSTDKLIPVLFFLTIIAVNIKGIVFFIPHGFLRLISFYYVYKISFNEGDKQ